jgi:hypothetical protein
LFFHVSKRVIIKADNYAHLHARHKILPTFHGEQFQEIEM